MRGVLSAFLCARRGPPPSRAQCHSARSARPRHSWPRTSAAGPHPRALPAPRFARRRCSAASGCLDQACQDVPRRTDGDADPSGQWLLANGASEASAGSAWGWGPTRLARGWGPAEQLRNAVKIPLMPRGFAVIAVALLRWRSRSRPRPRHATSRPRDRARGGGQPRRGARIAVGGGRAGAERRRHSKPSR